jgi:transposase
MSQQQLVPYDRVRDYFADQCKIPISTGSLFNFNKQAFELLVEYESIVKRHFITRPLLHAPSLQFHRPTTSVYPFESP